MTKIVFYTSDPKRFKSEIAHSLSLAASNSYQFQSVYCLDNLDKVLFRETLPPILILTALNQQELEELFIIRQLHGHAPTVLIVADESEVTLRKARKIKPVFLTCIEHGFSCVLSVVELIGRSMSQECPGKSETGCLRINRDGVNTEIIN